MKIQEPTQLGLAAEEIAKIRKLFGREPNWVEWGIFSLNWSEHCSYKTSHKFLESLPRTASHVLVGPGQNAGAIDLGNGLAVVFKVESHNHPSAIEPLHGAATGVGGIIRDILSMGARPIALLDSLRFGDPALWKTQWLIKGVVSGIGFYGNSIGVPTVGGEVRFGPGYTDNPLVNVLCVGIVPVDKIKKSISGKSENILILAGAPTGRDGIHGATFASDDLIGPEESKIPNVQIGDPFYGKLLIEATLEVAKIEGVVGLQDLGAGGLSTAPPEMAFRSKTGVHIQLENVPLRTPKLSPYEIVLSESQERMIISVIPDAVDKVIETYRRWGLPANVIGKFIEEPVFYVTYGTKDVARIPLDPLLRGWRLVKKSKPYATSFATPKATWSYCLSDRQNLSSILLEIIAYPDIASKRWVYEQYDWSVQDRTTVGPGKGDSAVLWLRPNNDAIAVAMDGNWRWTSASPYEGTKRIVLEAASNLASSGARPLAITDCLNFANPQEEVTLSEFEKSVQGMRDACVGLGIPVVSGNVSFYNQSERFRIPPTPIVGMVGYIPDIEKIPCSFFQFPENRIFLIGQQDVETSGSLYEFLMYGNIKAFRGEIDPKKVAKYIESLLQLIAEGLVISVRDVAEGGLIVSLAEMVIMGKCGVSVKGITDESTLFGETPGRWVVEVPKPKINDFLNLATQKGLPLAYLGQTHVEKDLVIGDHRIPVEVLFQQYTNGFNQIVE